MASRCLVGSMMRQSSRLFCTPSRIVSSSRCVATAPSDRISLSIDDKTGVATLALNRPPVNSLNLELLTDLSITMEKLEDEKTVQGLIITSANGGIFSAGLDILEMYQQKEERLREFWRTLQEFWLRLYGSRLPTIAAINGHSPAGGCLMAMACDYRIMAEGKYTIGLNETQLGIVAPFWFKDTMLNCCGHRQTEMALQLGTMFTTESALKIGMIDEAVPEADVYTAAQAQLKIWLRIPDAARQITKEMMRKPSLERLANNRQADIDNFVSFITRPGVQNVMGLYLANLKKKAAAKK